MSELDRIRCCVPFCRRTAPRKGKFADCTEIICGKHWRMAPAALRARRARIMRLWRRATMRGDLSKQRQAWHLEIALWDLIKARAIETAAGVV